MNFNKWRTAKILLLAVGILLCQNGRSTAAGQDLAIQGIWELKFSPPYMSPSRRRPTESYFHLKLSPLSNGQFTGRAIWDFGIAPTDGPKRISASVAGQMDQNKNVSIELFESTKDHDGGELLLLKGQFDGTDIKGSVDNGSNSDLAYNNLKYSAHLPSSGAFTLHRIKPGEKYPEEEKYIEAEFKRAD